MPYICRVKKKYLMKTYLSLICLFGVLFSVHAQNTGTLKGQVYNQKHKPIAYANVSIENSSFGKATASDGAFVLKSIPEGNYWLKVSYVGYETVELSVKVIADEITTLAPIVLKPSDENLATVLINGEKKNGFTRQKTAYVAKMPLKQIENPQVYTAITHEVLESQVVTSFDDALKNAAGLTKLWESTGRGTDGAGYYSLRGFAVQPTLVNGLPGLVNGSPDPANIESIQVVKGPSGTLFGSSLISYGGLINIVTKKPYNYFGGNIGYTTGSYGLNRVTADVNTPLAEGVNLRVNAAYTDRNSFQDAGFKTSYFIAPSLSYQVNDRLSFLINTSIYNSKGTNPTMLFLDRAHPLATHNMDELKYDNKKSYTSDDIFLENPAFSLQAQMNYKLSDEWTSQTVYSRSSTQSKGYYSYLYEDTHNYITNDASNGLPLNGVALEEGAVFNRLLNHQNSKTLTTDIQQNFTGDFKIGQFRNRLIVGLDYFQQRLKNSSTGYLANGIVYIGEASQQNVNESVFGITDPAQYLSNHDSGILSKSGVDALFANANVTPTESKQETFSAYASDVFNLLPELSVMASLRVDYFKNSTDDQVALSPKFGVVYQPIMDKWSIFANYMDGFSNVAPVTDLNQNILEFDPEHAKQFEFGTKVNLFENRLTATLSYYDIEVSNTVISPAPNVYTQGGELYSRGVELSLAANPVEGLNIIAGYSHNESKLTKASAGNDFVGLRPESAGPKDMANLWATYQFTDGTLNGFGVGFGGNYASENMIFNRHVAGQFTLDAYTVLNASVFYKTDKFGVTLKLNNLNDEEYYNGWSTINPQVGRNLTANFTYFF